MKTHRTHLLQRVALLTGLCTLAMGCDSPLPKGYSINDDLGEITLSLTRTYAIGQRVNINFYGENSQSEQLSVESSDPSLIKPIAAPVAEVPTGDSGGCIGDALCGASASPEPAPQEGGGRTTQGFELIGEGEATLIFKDAGAVIQEMPVRLVKATRVEAHVYYGGVASKLGGDTLLAEGAKFVMGAAHQIQLIPYFNDKALYISSLLEQPSLEGATLESIRAPFWQEGVVLDVRPEEAPEGTAEARELSIHAQLAGINYSIALRSVPMSAVRDIKVSVSRDNPMEITNEDGTTREVPVAIAFAQGLDADGGTIYGAPVTWERADGSESVEGSSLRFEYSETDAPVPFIVTSGSSMESVGLPMNPRSMILSSDGPYTSCSAAPGGGRGLPLIVLLSLAFALRPRRRAA